MKALWDPIGNKQEEVIVKVVCTHACVMNHGAKVILIQEYIESKSSLYFQCNVHKIKTKRTQLCFDGALYDGISHFSFSENIYFYFCFNQNFSLCPLCFLTLFFVHICTYLKLFISNHIVYINKILAGEISHHHLYLP